MSLSKYNYTRRDHGQVLSEYMLYVLKSKNWDYTTKQNQTICVLCFWLRLGLALVEGGGTGGTGATRLLKLKTDQPSYTHAKSRDPHNNKESSGMSKPFLLKVEVRVVDLP